MNEPVGIVKKITIGGIDNFPIEQFVRLKEGTLLYTHPVKDQLTVEEITELKNALKDCEYKIYPSKKQWESYLVLEKYAERLLRKAQEK